MLNTRIEKLCRLLHDGCLASYGDCLVSLVVFGSWARDCATWESDLDLLIIATELPKSRSKRLAQFLPLEQQTEAVRQEVWAEQKSVLEVSPIIKTPEELQQGSGLFLDMTEWRIVLFDRHAFFENYMAALKARMASLGHPPSRNVRRVLLGISAGHEGRR